MYFRKHEKQQQNQIVKAMNKARLMSHRLNMRRRAGFGLNEVIGASVAVMIAALVVVPGMRDFSTSVIDELSLWWTSIASKIFSVV
ncbi:MAG: hypothetical protein H6Q62_354 [Firmicutes bacterium]|nr:hypothetical protein [Bacillota bacterium]